MIDETLNMLCLVTAMILFSVTLQTVYATHVSEPVLTNDPNIQYKSNQTFSVNGWVKYNDQPASNVLVLLRLTNPNSDEIFRDEVRSNSSGIFTSNINLAGLNVTEIGTYVITAESQCRDEHRSICNHNSTSQIIQLIN
jgi:hypothetical protein